jgi:acetate kinase
LATGVTDSGLILTVNAGSSSVRFGLAAAGAGASVRLLDRARHGRDASEAQLRAFVDGRDRGLRAVAHRVVHGGTRHFATTLFDEAVTSDVAAATVLAPLHNPATLSWLERARRCWPQLPHLAVFDTGYFAGLPAVAATYALPAELADAAHLRRLGFHGLAHRSLWQTFTARRPERASRVISFQLGSGCSAAALLDGRPVDTSMGFTPLEGLVMATRCGDLDPGIVLHLLRKEGLSVEQLARILEERSGLAGVSGTDGAFPSLLASPGPAARLAVDLFCYRARKYLGAYLAVLGGADAVLLGGGVAERSLLVRERILTDLGGLGLVLDPARNQDVAGDGRISADDSAIEVWVLPTDEEQVMAEEAAGWLSS